CNYWAKAHYIWNFIILIGLKPNPIHKLPPAFVLNGGGGFHRYKRLTIFPLVGNEGESEF
ncbi:MAG: hypothetical protein WBI06_04805, partial [Paludibacter sp.]